MKLLIYLKAWADGLPMLKKPSMVLPQLYPDLTNWLCSLFGVTTINDEWALIVLYCMLMNLFFLSPIFSTPFKLYFMLYLMFNLLLKMLIIFLDWALSITAIFAMIWVMGELLYSNYTFFNNFIMDFKTNFLKNTLEFFKKWLPMFFFTVSLASQLSSQYLSFVLMFMYMNVLPSIVDWISVLFFFMMICLMFKLLYYCGMVHLPIQAYTVSMDWKFLKVYTSEVPNFKEESYFNSMSLFVEYMWSLLMSHLVMVFLKMLKNFFSLWFLKLFFLIIQISYYLLSAFLQLFKSMTYKPVNLNQLVTTSDKDFDPQLNSLSAMMSEFSGWESDENLNTLLGLVYVFLAMVLICVFFYFALTNMPEITLVFFKNYL